MKNILLFFSLVFLATSCSEDAVEVQNDFIGSWRLVSVKVAEEETTQEVPVEEDIVFSFTNPENYSGNTSVNQFGGRYRLEGTNTLTLLEFATTEVADTQFATAFYAAITEAIVPESTFAQFSYALEGRIITLTFRNGGELVLAALQ